MDYNLCKHTCVREAGTWKETNGFTAGGGLFGKESSNRGASVIVYKGQWKHGEVRVLGIEMPNY
jgi:hypothetical protein